MTQKINLKNFFKYFTKQWLPYINDNFLFYQDIDQRVRTNNCIESYYALLKSTIPKNTSISELISFLQQEEKNIVKKIHYAELRGERSSFKCNKKQKKRSHSLDYSYSNSDSYIISEDDETASIDCDSDESEEYSDKSITNSDNVSSNSKDEDINSSSDEKSFIKRYSSILMEEHKNSDYNFIGLKQKKIQK